MCRKNVLTIVAVAILALAIGQVQAVTVTVPNSGFELIYKPGTDILGVVSDGGWTMGVGPACPIDNGQYIFDDGTTGDVADIPGWLGYDRQGWIDLGGTYGRDETTGNFQGSVTTQGAPQHDGIHCFNANGGGYGNAAGGLIVSDASLGNVKAGIYVLSMYVKNAQGAPALPRVLDLLADGVVVTPTSSVDPAPSGDWQEYTRTYDFTNLTSYVGQAITIVLGVGRPLPDGATGAQSHFDNVSLSYELVIQATNPIPADEATDASRNPVLSWTPGIYADKHDVYFGTDFDDVNDATTTVDPNNVYKGRQDTNRYPIADTLNLDFGQTYYWRIDEVSAPPDSTIFKGFVWSFTVEPFAYPIDGNNITATASSSDSGTTGPGNTINGSGLDANDLHSTEKTDMWLSGSEPLGASIQYEFDKVYKLHEMWIWNFNVEFESALGFGFKDVTIEYSADGSDWTVLGSVPDFAQGPGTPDYAHNTQVDFGGALAKHVKITANSNWGSLTQYGLSEVRFFYIPVWAREPNPQDEATDVGPDVVLNWRAGREADTHEVYLSSNRKDVVDGTASVGSVSEASYDAGTLELGRTYYWRVDEVNQAEVPTSWEGDIWNFATPEYLVVDDFEDYDAGENQIWYAWRDGLGFGTIDTLPYYPGNGTGSAVGDESTSNYMEQTIFYGGSYSMPFVYDNSGAGGKLRYSETFHEWSVPQNWTANGVKALVVPFYGDPANAPAPLYVAVEDSMGNIKDVAYNNGDPDAVLVSGWQEFQIPLTDFTGVTLSSVKKLYFGVGNRNFPQVGGTGTLYIDDIGLYPSRCVLSKRSADFARVDYVQDCVVDYKELEVMAENWLAVAAAPGTVLNGDFEEIYKPGSVTITAELGGWTQGVGPDTLMDSGIASYSDGTDGDWVDVPGWIGADPEGWVAGGGTYERDTDFPNRQGSIQANGVEGSYCFLANGSDWGNPAGGLIVSDAPLGNVEDGIYTLSMVASGGATPVVLELLAGGIALTPTSSADPALTGDFQEFSRTYDSASLVGFLGEPLTIRLGVGREASGTQTRFDNVTLFHSPEPLPTEILRLAGRRVDLYEDKKIDFKDFAELAVWWLDEQLWPQ